MSLESNFGTEKGRMLAESIRKLKEEIKLEDDQDKKEDLIEALEKLENK